jgi:hypothetical protein
MAKAKGERGKRATNLNYIAIRKNVYKDLRENMNVVT